MAYLVESRTRDQLGVEAVSRSSNVSTLAGRSTPSLEAFWDKAAISKLEASSIPNTSGRGADDATPAPAMATLDASDRKAPSSAAAMSILATDDFSSRMVASRS